MPPISFGAVLSFLRGGTSPPVELAIRVFGRVGQTRWPLYPFPAKEKIRQRAPLEYAPADLEAIYLARVFLPLLRRCNLEKRQASLQLSVASGPPLYGQPLLLCQASFKSTFGKCNR